jgi:hypothetical protein
MFDGQARQGRESTVVYAADASDSTRAPIILLEAVGLFATLHQSDHARREKTISPIFPSLGEVC